MKQVPAGETYSLSGLSEEDKIQQALAAADATTLWDRLTDKQLTHRQKFAALIASIKGLFQ